MRNLMLWIATCGYLALIACATAGGSAGGADDAHEEAAARCPPPGTRVAYKRLTALAKDYVGCDVEVEAELLDTSWGSFTCPSVSASGRVAFRIIEPGTQPSVSPLGGVAQGFLALIPKEAADPILAASNGSRLILRGGVFWESWQVGRFGSGHGCGVFMAASARPSP